eukprot:1274523-Rhodomonas_salina.2
MEDEVVTEVESPQFDLNMTLASPTPSSAPYQGLYLQETSFDGSVASTQSSRRSYASVTISSLQGQGPEDWSIGNVLESKVISSPVFKLQGRVSFFAHMEVEQSPERQRRIARLKRPPTRSTESVQIPPQKDPRKEEIWLVNHAVDVERRLRLELLEVRGLVSRGSRLFFPFLFLSLSFPLPSPALTLFSIRCYLPSPPPSHKRCPNQHALAQL